MKIVKILGILFLFLNITDVTAQKNTQVKVYGISLDTLSKMVKNHPKYFEHLRKKWTKTPEKITDDEMILLYYGSAFMKDYQPKNEDNSIEKMSQTINELDFETAIKNGEKLINVYPLNSRLYMLLGYAYKQIGQINKSKDYYKRYAQLLRVPLYSGNGKSFEKAFVVRTVSDEYLILNNKDLELVQLELRYHLEKPYDVMLITAKLKNNERMKTLPKEKLYFNVYLPFFIGEGKNYKMVQQDALKKYKKQIKKSK